MKIKDCSEGKAPTRPTYDCQTWPARRCFAVHTPAPASNASTSALPELPRACLPFGPLRTLPQSRNSFHRFSRTPALQSRMPYPLVPDLVRYAGEPVAIVAAENAYQAEDALDLIDIEYEPLPAAVDTEASLHDTAPRVHDDLPNNFAGRFGQEVGDVDRALAEAFVVINERFTIGRVSAQPMETRAITASYESGKLTVWMTTQSPHMSRRVIAQQLDMPLENVHVIAPDIGGGFGPKNRHYPEYTLVPMLAVQLGRPVAWVEDRRESFTATYQAREQVHDVTLALAEDGKVLALWDRYIYDQGAYTPIGIVVPFVTSVSIPGPYRIPNYRVECSMAFTNKTPTAPYRGAENRRRRS